MLLGRRRVKRAALAQARLIERPRQRREIQHWIDQYERMRLPALRVRRQDTDRASELTAGGFPENDDVLRVPAALRRLRANPIEGGAHIVLGGHQGNSWLAREPVRDVHARPSQRGEITGVRSERVASSATPSPAVHE